ncbi:hypothetical protein D3C71_25360 [compost metagenome]
MLTAAEIQTIAQSAGARCTFGWKLPESYTSDLASPQPVLAGIRVLFERPDPSAWAQLMSAKTEVPVEILGTRRVSGSGAIDGTLEPVYADLLDQVNVKRREVGLVPVRN